MRTVYLPISRFTRLGNWLFQYAAALPHADAIVFCARTASVRRALVALGEVWPGARVEEAVPAGIPVFVGRDPVCTPWPESDGALLAEGLFQDVRWLTEMARRRLACPPHVAEVIRGRLPEAFAEGAPVGVSVRRGDYLRLPRRHPFVGRDFLRRAVEAFPEGAAYLVCSDDIPWCKAFFARQRFPGRRFHFVEGMSPLWQLWAQSLCAHNIISNSSFSWWGAWLNTMPGRRVLAPLRWFGPDCEEPAEAPGLAFEGMERLTPGFEPWLPIAQALARGRIALGDCLRALGLRRRVREGD